MTDSIEQTIADNAAGPKKAAGDAGSVEQHSLKDQIELEKYLQAKRAAKQKGLGIKFVTFTPGGTV